MKVLTYRATIAQTAMGPGRKDYGPGRAKTFRPVQGSDRHAWDDKESIAISITTHWLTDTHGMARNYLQLLRT